MVTIITGFNEAVIYKVSKQRGEQYGVHVLFAFKTPHIYGDIYWDFSQLDLYKI